MADVVNPPTLFLYTDTAALDDNTRAKMVAAGYLPVRVDDLSQVKLIEHRVSLSRDVLDAIGQAALAAVAISGSDYTKVAFTKRLAELLNVARFS